MSVLEQSPRVARLKLSKDGGTEVLTAAVPIGFAEGDFNHLGKAVVGLIRRQTGCNCLSGRIKVVIEDDFSDVIRVDLGPAVGGG